MNQDVTGQTLRQGSAKWNSWREAGDDEAPIDLTCADLRTADLCEANFRYADLTGANLKEAELRGATLSYADFTDADLSGASLLLVKGIEAEFRGAVFCKADLSGAIFSDTNFEGADLEGASLEGAYFGGADLSGANLSEAVLENAHFSGTELKGVLFYNAQFGDTLFVNVDLSSVVGLETCIHSAPSVVNFRTLQLSGSLPLAFLQGVGFSDSFIDFLPSFLQQPIQMYSCFISYSSKDQEFANRLHADLQSKGVRCWFAPHDLPIGAKTWDAIDEAIRLRDKLLLILSKRSITSDWVEDEVNKAFAEERHRKRLVLFPLKIDDAVMQTPEPGPKIARSKEYW